MAKRTGPKYWAGVVWFGIGVSLSNVGFTKLLFAVDLRYPLPDPRYVVAWGWLVLAAVMIIGPTALLILFHQIGLGNGLTIIGWVGLLASFVLPPTSWYRNLVEVHQWVLYIPGLMALVSYVLTKAIRKRTGAEGKTGSWDEPKTDPLEDRFDRKPLAKLVADAILSPTPTAPGRIAIYGPWGSGKTTFLSFLKTYLELRVPVASFNPWKYRSGEAAWNGFIQSVEQALINHGGEWTKYELFIREWTGVAARMMRTGWKPQTEVGKKLADLLSERILDSIENKKERLSSVLTSALGPRGRLVVLVDDMDRVDPQLAVDILSHIKELLDFPQLTYIIAVDYDALTLALASTLKGLDHEGAKRYLEKIVQWPIELSPSTPSQVLEDDDIKSGLDQSSREALVAINGVLPSNPRQLKRLVWTVAVQYQPGQLDVDVNRPFLYACKLMQMYYPDALRKILTTDDLRKALGLSGKLLMAGDDREKQLSKWRETLFAGLRADNPEDADRIWNIFIAMVEQSGPDPSREITLATQGVEDRGTEELFRSVYVAWQATTGPNKRQCAERVLRDADVGQTLAWQRMFARALATYDETCSRMVDATPEEWVLREIGGAAELGRFVHDMLEIAAGHSAPLSCLGPDQFAILWRTCTAYANFTHPDYYLPLRSQEKGLLQFGVKLIEEHPADYLSPFKGFSPVLSDRDKAVKPLREYVLNQLLSKRADQIVQMFAQPGAILPLIVDKAFWWDRELLLSRSKWLHNPDVRKRLYSTLEDCNANPIIIDNLYHYFTFLSSPNIHADIREDREFVTRLWSILVAARLNYRSIGSLLQAKINLESQWGTPGTLVIPDDPLWTNHPKNGISQQ